MNKTKAGKAKRKQVEADLLAAYRECCETTMASKRDASRIKFLRPSQLPFCAPSFFVRHATMGMVSTLDYLGAFYTSVGTTVHEVVQRYLAPGSKLLADWHCKPCNKWRRLSTNSECKCGRTMDYHEVLINHKGVVGHIDAIFKDRYGKYWILDFKTSTLTGSGYKKKSPGYVYKEQVETYALMLKLQYGIKVEGVMLMFIPRDDPTKPTVWTSLLDSDDFVRIQKRTNKYKKRHKQTLDAETWDEVKELAGFGKCKNPYCEICTSSASVIKKLRAAYKIGKQKGYLPLAQLQ